MVTNADRYWEQFVRSLSPAERRPESYLEFFYYGVEPKDGRPVGELVLSGTKTAGGDILWRREAANQPPLEAGSFSIFHDGYGEPMGIIETTEVKVVPFDEVDADFACDCGEWDRTIENWRKAYWSWIEAECAKLGRYPSPQIPMICERYRLVYSEPLRAE